MRSIRANLLVWVVGALAVGIGVVLSATYVLTRSQVGSLFDEELKQVAVAVHLGEDWIESGRLRLARAGFSLTVRAYDKTGRIYFETALPSFPDDTPLTYAEGFTRLGTSRGVWRVYTHVTEEGIVQVGHPVATRDALARDLSLRTLMPMLLLIPFLAVLMAWVLKRGLEPIQITSDRVSHRDASRLEPLPVENVPLELVPLVGEINALLRRLDASLGGQRRFLADAAHELRTPVSALALQVQLAARAQGAEARAAALADLTAGIERTRRLVQQLLDFARLEPGVQAAPFEPMDLAQLAREVVGELAPRAEELGVDLGAEASGPVRVDGARAELRSLIENLLDNALRYAPRDSAVTLSVQRGTRWAEMRVVDAGPGIPESERAQVFERFHRVAGDVTPGSGLGLAIARAIVERHGGAITLRDAQPGQSPPGLAVVVRLPSQ